MPFKSEKQRRWMHATKPEIAKKWEKKYKKESMSPTQVKKMRDEFNKTGELPPHLKKMANDLKKFKVKHKVKNIVVPGMEWMTTLGEERDYKDEYKKFQSSTKSKKYRAELNKYNRKKGTYGNGDGKDASHKGGKIVGFESQSKNRGRAEKSRLKKEVQVNELTPPMSVSNPTAYKAMLDKQISKNVKVKTALGNKDHKDHKKAKGFISRFMDKFKKKKDEPKKSKATPTSAADFRRSRKESVKESDLGLTYKKNKTVKVKHKTSGKRLVIVDKPAVRKEYEKIGYFAESINEMKVYKQKEGRKKVQSMKKISAAKIYKHEKRTGKMGGKTVRYHVLHTKNTQHGTGRNPYGLDMSRKGNKAAYIIAVEEPYAESVDEGLNVQAYSDLNRSIKSVANNVKDLAKAHKKQDDGVVRNEIDNLLYDVKRMVNIIGNKKYNESVDEGKYTVHFDMGSPGLMSKTVDAKDKKEAAKKVASGLSGKFKIKKVTKESVDEGEKRQSSEITAKFDKAYLNFAREVRDVISRVDRSTGDRTDGKIIAKAYTKHLLPLDKLMQSWNKTQQKNPHIDEGFADKLTKKNDANIQFSKR